MNQRTENVNKQMTHHECKSLELESNVLLITIQVNYLGAIPKLCNALLGGAQWGRLNNSVQPTSNYTKLF